MNVSYDSCKPGWRSPRAERLTSTRFLLLAAILDATFLTYAATLDLGFVFDDHVLIVTNDSIRSWRYFPGYLASHLWSFRYPHLLAQVGMTSYCPPRCWRP